MYNTCVGAGTLGHQAGEDANGSPTASKIDRRARRRDYTLTSEAGRKKLRSQRVYNDDHHHHIPLVYG